MTEKKDTLLVNVNVEITTAALKAIVANTKKNTEPDSNGVYRIDTADKVSQVISRFLLEHDFEAYAKDPKNCL